MQPCLWRVVLTLSIALLTSLSVTAAESSDLSCIESIELPSIINSLAGEPIANGSSIQIFSEGMTMPISERHAKALITVGRDGKPVAILVTGNSKGTLNAEIENQLKLTTRFNLSCAEKAIELNFVYRFGGTVKKNPALRVLFRAPNTFVFEKEPGVAIIDEIPVRQR